MISICNVVEFELCVIFACYIFSISIKVMLSLKHWGLEYFYAWGAKKALDETYYNASKCGESDGASLWGDLDQDQ